MKKILFSLLSILVIMLLPCKAFAVELTDDNLRTALEKVKNYTYKTSTGETKKAELIDSYTLDTTNKKLTIENDNKQITYDYTLGANPTFTNTKTFTNSLTLDLYNSEDDSSLWMLPHIVVLNAQGVNVIDAAAYEMSFLMKLLNNQGEIIIPYAEIINDTQLEVSSQNGIATINKSEFGQYIVNYFKDNFVNEKTIYQDNLTDLLNSFKVTIKAINATSNSVDLNYKITIDTTINYSSLNGMAKEMGVDIVDYEETIEQTNKPTKINPITTTSQEIPVPDTVINYPKIIIVVGLLITILGSVFLLKYLKTEKTM